MKEEGIRWVSVAAGILAVALGWLVFENKFSPEPRSDEPHPLTKPGGDLEVASRPENGSRENLPPPTPSPAESSENHPFRICLRDAITGKALEGGEILDNRINKVLGRTDKNGCLSLKGLDPGVLVIHCPGYFLSLIPEAAREKARKTGEALVSLFPASGAAFLDLKAVWPGGTPPPKGRLRIRVDRYGPSKQGERSFPTARFGEGTRVSPQALRAWEQHMLLASSVQLDEGWFLGGYGGISLPPEGGRVYFPHRGKFLIRARDDSGTYWAKANVNIHGQDQSPLLLKFSKGRLLAFLIQDPQGKPVPGARVVLTFPAEEAGGRYENLSDEKGEVLLTGIAETHGGRLQVLAPDFKEKRVDLPTLPKKRTAIVLEPLPSKNVSFVVQEIRSHKPLGGVEVLVGNPAHPNQKALSDKRGRVRVRLIPGQVRILTFRKKGYLTYGELLEILPGAPPPRIFEMVPSDPEKQRKLGLVALVRGSIFDARGKPLKGAPIYLAVEGEGFTRISNPMSRKIVRGAIPRSVTQTVSDDKGRFLLVSANGGKAKLIWGGESFQQKTFVVKAGQVLHFRLTR